MIRLRIKKKIQLFILMIVLYGFQYFILPAIFPQYYRGSNEAIVFYWGSLTLTIIVGYLLVSVKLFNWLFADMVYVILSCIYSANGAYGAGYGGYYHLKSVVIEMLISLVLLLFLQFLVRMLCNFIKCYRNLW